MPTKITASPAIAGFRFHCRDKIEPNLQSQNVHRTHSVLVESRFQRDSQNTTLQRGVNTQPLDFAGPEKPIPWTFAEAFRIKQLALQQSMSTVTQITRLRNATRLTGGGLSRLRIEFFTVGKIIRVAGALILNRIQSTRLQMTIEQMPECRFGQCADIARHRL